MKTEELTRHDLNLLLNRAMIIQMSVEEARKLIDQIEDDDLTNAIDQAQGAVLSESINAAWVILKIVP
jgi:hypothetical protein